MIFKAMDWNDFFICDPEAGTLTWRVRPREHFPTKRAYAVWNARYSGKKAGHAQFTRLTGHKAGSVYVRVFNKMYKAHRIIWEMCKGPIPPGALIDHKNGDFFNNRLSNIRTSDPSQNMHNSQKRMRNTSGFKGVYEDKRDGMFEAKIMVNRVTHRLGRFADVNDAAAAYREASIRLLGKFAFASRPEPPTNSC